MNPEPHDNGLRALLRQGDPAGDGSELSREESASLRRAVLRGAPTSSPGRWLPLAGAAAAAVLAAVLLLPGPDSTTTPPATESRPTAAEIEAGGAASSRQIRFATERGTQIIWVLDPNLDL